MKKQLTEAQKAKKIAAIIRHNDLKDGKIVYAATEIANVLIAINALNTERRNASDVQLAASYLNTIGHHNQYSASDAQVSAILYNAYKGILSASDAATLAAFAIEEEISL